MRCCPWRCSNPDLQIGGAISEAREIRLELHGYAGG